MKQRKRISDFIKEYQQRKRSRALLAALSIVVVASVYAAMCMPAISLARSQPVFEAERVAAVFGGELTVRVSAEAPEGEQPSVFVLHTLSTGGGLSGQYEFDDQETFVLETEDGGALELHREREEAGETNYWFTLEQGERTAFLLNCASDSYVAPDNLQDAVIPAPDMGGGVVGVPGTSVPEEAPLPGDTEAPADTAPPENTDAPETAPPEDTADPEDTPAPDSTTPPESTTPPTETVPPAETPGEGGDQTDAGTSDSQPPAEDPAPAPSEPSQTEPDDGAADQAPEPAPAPEPEPAPEAGPETVVMAASRPSGLLADLFLPAYALDEDSAGQVLGESGAPSGGTDAPSDPPPSADGAPSTDSAIDGAVGDENTDAGTDDAGAADGGDAGSAGPDADDGTAQPPDGESTPAPEDPADGETQAPADTVPPDQTDAPETDAPDADGEAPTDVPDPQPEPQAPGGGAAVEGPDLSFLAGDGEDQYLIFAGGMGGSYKDALRAAKHNDGLEFTWKETLQEKTLTARTADGVVVTMTGVEDVFPGGVDSLTLEIEELLPPDLMTLQAQAELDPVSAAFRALKQADEGEQPLEHRLFDIRLLRDGEEVEPLGQVRVTFSGLIDDAGQTDAKVYHMDGETGGAVDMDARVRSDGTVVMETDHFSTYGLSLFAVTGNHMELEDILDGLGIAKQFAVFADRMDAQGHMEGSIAVQELQLVPGAEFDFGNTSSVGGSDGASGALALTITKKVVGTAPADAVYLFGIFDSAGEQVETVTIGGAGSATIDLTPGAYRVYELDGAGDPLAQGEGEGFEVSYDTLNLSGYLGGGDAGSVNNASYIETFLPSSVTSMKTQNVGTLFVGEDCTVDGNKITCGSYTVEAMNLSGGIGQPTSLDWDSEFDALQALSERLAACTATDYSMADLSTPGVRFLNVTVPESGVVDKSTIAKMIGASDANLNSGIPLGGEQYLVINLDCGAIAGNTVTLPDVAANSNNAAGWKEDYGRMIWNVHDGGSCYGGSVRMSNAAAGIILAPEATVEQNATFGGSIIAEHVIRSSHEIHQHSFRVNGEAKTTVTNTYPEKTGPELVLHKQGPQDEALSGVVFALYAADENWEKAAEEPVSTQTTAEGGELSFGPVKPGNYLLYEVQAADGYMKPAAPWRVRVTEETISFLTSDGVQPWTDNLLAENDGPGLNGMTALPEADIEPEADAETPVPSAADTGSIEATGTPADTNAGTGLEESPAPVVSGAASAAGQEQSKAVFTITNQKLTDTTSVTVTKNWVGDGGEHPDTIDVHLLANGKRIEYATLGEDNGWTYTWTGLRTADDDSTQIFYTVEEDPVDGYYSTITRDEPEDEAAAPAAGAETGWKEVDRFTDGKEYLLVANGKAVGTASGSSLKGIIASAVINGSTRPQDAVWKATGNGTVWGLNTFQLTNPASGRSLYCSNYTVYAKTDGEGSFIYNAINKNQLHVYSGGGFAALSAPSNREGGIDAGSSNAKYTLYEWQGASGTSLSFTITNTKQGEVPENPDLMLAHKKTIDALREGGNNPDTALDDQGGDLTDLYRLYLDVEGGEYATPVDLLLVIDNSGSMVQPDKKIDGMTRLAVLNKVLSEEGGLIDTFLDGNADNRIATVYFSGPESQLDEYGQYYGWGNYYYYYGKNDLPVFQEDGPKTYPMTSAYGYGRKTFYGDAWTGSDWTGDAAELKRDLLKTSPNGWVATSDADSQAGTNYAAGLQQALRLLEEDAESGHVRQIIFLSDGVPTYYLTDGRSAALTGSIRGGTGYYDQADDCIGPTEKAIRQFQEICPYPVSTIGFGGSGDDTSARTDLLTKLSQNGGSYYNALDTATLRQALQEMIAPHKVTNVSMTDDLSQYVEWYGQCPDVLVTMTNRETGHTTTLWKGTGRAESGVIGMTQPDNVFSLNGSSAQIVQSVTYTPAEGGETTGRVSVVFDPRYELDPDYTYTLSFNVQATQTAYEEYAENLAAKRDGYGDVEGDPGTDYGDNQTSSGKPGFHSNQQAFVNYVVDNKSYMEPYDHPVIQTAACALTIRKTDLTDTSKLLPGAEFHLYRAAEAGMDGAEAVPGTDDLYGILFGQPLVAGADGSVTVRDLPSGSEWYLVETRAPTGYQPLSRPIHFKLYRDHVDVSGDGADQNMVQGTEQGAGHDENGLPILVVKNTNGYGLPATGGAGTAAFTLLGLLLSAAAAATLLYQRRRRERGST